MFTRSYYFFWVLFWTRPIKVITVQKFLRVAFTMQCNSEKFQPGQIAFLTENREGINAT